MGMPVILASSIKLSLLGDQDRSVSWQVCESWAADWQTAAVTCCLGCSPLRCVLEWNADKQEDERYHREENMFPVGLSQSGPPVLGLSTCQVSLLTTSIWSSRK